MRNLCIYVVLQVQGCLAKFILRGSHGPVRWDRGYPCVPFNYAHYVALTRSYTAP